MFIVVNRPCELALGTCIPFGIYRLLELTPRAGGFTARVVDVVRGKDKVVDENHLRDCLCIEAPSQELEAIVAECTAIRQALFAANRAALRAVLARLRTKEPQPLANRSDDKRELQLRVDALRPRLVAFLQDATAQDLVTTLVVVPVERAVREVLARQAPWRAPA